ncbi:cytochrome c [Hoeflea sp. YIM 152468]|uniref:c-type cytochrome n=1 Tax=Hoeflea sp. YIM 152468 TaxID=3031759 RepID=UPI0023D9D362|nr:cytochrome c [Hoeflea sp. YIM 152468]MDF1608480.1 cytochrome c [Hoeflea sp. YIM 152468]
MRFRTFVAAAIIGAAGFAPAIAADEPQVVRQEMMKKVGGATGAMAKMVKGEADFDAAATLAALSTISEVAGSIGAYFPQGSETGFETEAAPAIWTDMDGFTAKLAGLKADADAAVAAAPADLDALKAVFGPLTKNCGACHETYRLKKS